MSNLAENLQRASWLARLDAIVRLPKESLAEPDTREWLAKTFCKFNEGIRIFEMKTDGEIPAELVLRAMQSYSSENAAQWFASLFALSQKLRDGAKLDRKETRYVVRVARCLRKYLLDERHMP